MIFYGKKEIEELSSRDIVWAKFPTHETSQRTKKGYRPCILIPLTAPNKFYGTTNYLAVPFTASGNTQSHMKEFVVNITLEKPSMAELYNTRSMDSTYLVDEGEVKKYEKEINNSDIKDGKISVEKFEEIVNTHLKYHEEVAVAVLKLENKRPEITKLRESVQDLKKVIQIVEAQNEEMKLQNEEMKLQNEELRLLVNELVQNQRAEVNNNVKSKKKDRGR